MHCCAQRKNRLATSCRESCVPDRFSGCASLPVRTPRLVAGRRARGRGAAALSGRGARFRWLPPGRFVAPGGFLVACARPLLVAACGPPSRLLRRAWQGVGRLAVRPAGLLSPPRWFRGGVLAGGRRAGCPCACCASSPPGLLLRRGGLPAASAVPSPLRRAVGFARPVCGGWGLGRAWPVALTPPPRGRRRGSRVPSPARVARWLGRARWAGRAPWWQPWLPPRCAAPVVFRSVPLPTGSGYA